LNSRNLIIVAVLCCSITACGKGEQHEQSATAEVPAPAAKPGRDAVHAFCVANYEQMVECVDDTAFWNIMGTLYVATDPQLAASAGAKQGWIEMMQAVARTLSKEGALAENCDAAVDHNQWPTAAQIARVAAARTLSCADFGNAFGDVMFNEGVFFAPKGPTP
jgi:hypothetical protein